MGVRLISATGALVYALSLAGPAAGQTLNPLTRGLREITFSAGALAESYRGNLSAVTATVVDSTESAGAAIGELGINAIYDFDWLEQRTITLVGDVGLRQSAASGFAVRDYAPRELVGSLRVWWREWVGRWGHLDFSGGFRARGIVDRPPMPLFLQPGYDALDGEVRWWLPQGERVRFDLSVVGSRWNYHATAFAPQLDLLDRREIGVGLGASVGEASPLRFNLGYRATRYPDQRTFDAADPVRRDRTTQTGVEVELRASKALVRLGLLASLNRSNSRRPEYDAIAFDAAVSIPFDWQQIDLTLSSSITGKRYLTETEFARLVPGEEADNASVVFVTVSRPLVPQVRGLVRVGWTRAETDIGSEYYQRWGVGFFLEYRPFVR